MSLANHLKAGPPPQRRHRRSDIPNWIVLYCVVVQLLNGVAALGSPGTHAVPTETLSNLCRGVPIIEALVYLLAVALAIAGVRVGLRERLGLMLCIPSMILLWISAESSLQAIVQGRSSLRDQAPGIIAELVFTVSLFGAWPFRVGDWR